jgi:CSLREA domain-containing protein
MLQPIRLKSSHVFSFCSARPRTSRLLPALLIFGAFLTLFLFNSGTASAADYIVNSTADTSDGNCNAANCTLREALVAANDNPNVADKITITATGTINLNSRLPTIAGAVEIIGPGANNLTVQRNPSAGTQFGIFVIYRNIYPPDPIGPDFTVRISGMTIQNGFWVQNAQDFQDGGGILNVGATTIFSSLVISNNRAYNGGGGIKNELGNMTIRDSLIANNVAFGATCREQGWGGGILTEGGISIISNTTVISNTANRGGGVYINGFTVADVTTINNSQVISNAANLIPPGTPGTGLCKQPSLGGGIGAGSGGRAFINSTVISGNSSYSGGGMFSERGTILISGTTFTSNSVFTSTLNIGCGGRNGVGGGYYKISHTDNGKLSFVNSTFSENRSLRCNAGGLYARDEEVYLANTTFVGNQANTRGGGIDSEAGSARIYMSNSLLSGNTAPTGPDMLGPVDSQGYNLIANSAASSGWNAGNGDIVGQNANLQPFGNYGGSVPVYPLAPSSPALDAGNPAGCNFANGVFTFTVGVDARGYGRPANGRCDIGAAEMQAPNLDLNSGTLGTNHSTGFTEDSPNPAALSANPTVTADAEVISVTLKLTNPLNGAAEVLTATTTGTNISASYNPASSELLLSGADTLANYRAVLATATYRNTSQNPVTTTRLVEVTGYGTYGTGTTATASVAITAVNDTPVLSVPLFVDANEAITVSLGVSLSDVDANAGTISATVSITPGGGTLNMQTVAGVTFPNGTQGTNLTLSGTLTSVNTALATLSYQGDKYKFGQIVVTLAVDDNGNTGTGGAQTVDNQFPVNIASALVVTATNDNGDLNAGGFGSLSYAIAQANDSQRPAADRTITFAPALTGITLTNGAALPALNTGVTLQGRCGTAGPEIVINGNGNVPAANSAGIAINGGVKVSSVYIKGFNGLQLLARATDGANNVTCTRVSRS